MRGFCRRDDGLSTPTPDWSKCVDQDLLPHSASSLRMRQDLTDGRLNLNAVSYYHDLPGERGDSLEASLAYGTEIYASWLLPFSACSRCERAISSTAHDIPCTTTSFTVPPIQARPPRHSRAPRATLLLKRLNTHHYTHEKRATLSCRKRHP